MRIQMAAINVSAGRKVTAAQARKAIEELVKWGADTHNNIAKYPPARPSSTYVRTGNLGRKWTTSGPSTEGSNVFVEIGNNVVDDRGRPYATYVQGEWQTALHAETGWTVIGVVGNQLWARGYSQRVANALLGGI